MYFDLCDNYMYNATWACMIITWVCRGRSDWHSSPVFPLYLAQGSTGKGLWYIFSNHFHFKYIFKYNIIPHSHYIVFTVSRLHWKKKFMMIYLFPIIFILIPHSHYIVFPGSSNLHDAYLWQTRVTTVKVHPEED